LPDFEDLGFRRVEQVVCGVRLVVAGSAGINSLPYPLRDSHDEEFRVDRLFGLFDNPITKLALHVREAGEFFSLRPEDRARSRRWIEEVFGFAGSPWPEPDLYAVALMLPTLHHLAGREVGIEVAFRLVFGLPVRSIRLLGTAVEIRSGRRTRLGSEYSRLGMDAVAGIGPKKVTGVEVEFGPLTVAEYRKALNPTHRELRQELYRLVLPLHLLEAVVERWRVGDPSDSIPIGTDEGEILLSCNSYLAISEHGSAA